MAHLFFIEGPLGAGKTFFMSLLATHWEEKVRQAGGEIQLFSNYELANSEPMDRYEDWYRVAEAQGSIVCWDEAQMAFSNRKWSQYGQSIATEVIMYMRKFQSVQIFCSPSVHNVDSRIRQIIEILVSVRKIGESGFSLRFEDYQTHEFMMKQFIPMWKAKKFFKLNLYDTLNMVQPFPLPRTEKQGVEFFEKLQEIHDKARGKISI